MSYLSQTLRRGAVSCVAVAASIGLSAGAANAASLQAAAKCKYPIVGTASANLSVDAALPTEVEGTIPATPVRVELAFPREGGGVGLPVMTPGYRATGVIRLRVKVTLPDGSSETNTISAQVGEYTVPTNGTLGYATHSIVGTGTLPAIDTTGAGIATIEVVGFGPNLRMTPIDELGDSQWFRTPTTDVDGQPFADSDGLPETTDLPCRFEPAVAGVKLADVAVQLTCLPVILPPGKPGSAPISDADITSTSVHLRWTASPTPRCASPATSYRITYGDKTVEVPATQTDVVINGLSPETAYAFSVVGVGNNQPSESLVVNVTTDAGQTGEPLLGYALAGSTQIKTLTKGTLPLKGAIQVQPISGVAFTADLQLNDTTGRLVTAGFLPVTAKIGFVPSGKTTGLFADDVLKTASKVRIKVKEIKLFGAIPLAGGNSCQTRQLSDINLQSTEAGFTLAGGGSLTGTYKISDLNGCGVLNGVVSPLTAGDGNTIALTLTRRS